MGQMRWIDPNGEDGEKMLHVRMAEGDRWMPYTSVPHLFQPDTVIPGLQCSKGFRTAQVLLRNGFKYA